MTAQNKPVMVARAATIRQSIAAAEKYLLSLDDPRERQQQRDLIATLHATLRLAR